ANELLLLMVDHYPNLSIAPTPQFFDGDRLVDIHLPCTKVWKMTQLPADSSASLKLEVLLRPDNGLAPPIAALILSPREMIWLRQLLYLLPGEAFRDYILYQGEELSVLIGHNRPIEGLPFGIPLRRPGNRALFIPLRNRFVPDLPWSLLQEALALQENVYTFLTPDYRLDLSETLFTPLARVLVTEPHRPRVNVHMLTPSSLPTLTWTPPPGSAAETSPDGTKSAQSLANRDSSNGQAVARKSAVPTARRPVVTVPQTTSREPIAT